MGKGSRNQGHKSEAIMAGMEDRLRMGALLSNFGFPLPSGDSGIIRGEVGGMEISYIFRNIHLGEKEDG